MWAAADPSGPTSKAPWPPSAPMESTAILRHSRKDALFIGLTATHAVLLLCASALPVNPLPVVALGVWWNSNTISHNFVHKAFFRARWLNEAFSLCLTTLLGIPQTIWRERHLAHHANRCWSFRWSGRLALEISLILGVSTTLGITAPQFFFTAYLPGYVIGLALCSIHGHYEHSRGTISHHGRLYNWLFFNDGYHVEHHAAPGLHWSELPRTKAANAPTSRWPAVLRWIDTLQEAISLNSLERIVLRSRRLQGFVLRSHERALRELLSGLAPIKSVTVVGGGLFPRTALILEKLLPHARIIVLDVSLESLERARPFLGDRVELVHAAFDPIVHGSSDLVVIPLAFQGDREALYQSASGRWLIHDWIWNVRGRNAVVSPLLLKRINLLEPAELPCER